MDGRWTQKSGGKVISVHSFIYSHAHSFTWWASPVFEEFGEAFCIHSHPPLRAEKSRAE